MEFYILPIIEEMEDDTRIITVRALLPFEAKDPDYWSLYYKDDEGLSSAIADFDTKEAAEEALERYKRCGMCRLSRMLDPFEPPYCKAYDSHGPAREDCWCFWPRSKVDIIDASVVTTDGTYIIGEARLYVLEELYKGNSSGRYDGVGYEIVDVHLKKDRPYVVIRVVRDGQKDWEKERKSVCTDERKED